MTPQSTFDCREADEQKMLRRADLSAAKADAADTRMVADNYFEEWGERDDALEREAEAAEDYYHNWPTT